MDTLEVTPPLPTTPLRDDALTGQRILVTGGGSGIGKILATAFTAHGAKVFICGRRESVLREAVEAIDALGRQRAVSAACDISKPEQIDALFESIWTNGGPLTGVVNNAAGNFISRTEDLSPRAFQAISSIVSFGTFCVTLAAGKRWIRDRVPGSILSILSTHIWNGSPFIVPSVMSKAGIHAMTQSLAVEWGRYGIRLNGIAPGLFPTKGAWERLMPDNALEGRMVAETPLGRVGQPHEIANLAAFLMAPGAEFLTGHTIAIDGGALPASGGNFSGLLSWTPDQWGQARAAMVAANEGDRKMRTV